MRNCVFCVTVFFLLLFCFLFLFYFIVLASMCISWILVTYTLVACVCGICSSFYSLLFVCSFVCLRVTLENESLTLIVSHQHRLIRWQVQESVFQGCRHIQIFQNDYLQFFISHWHRFSFITNRNILLQVETQCSKINHIAHTKLISPMNYFSCLSLNIHHIKGTVKHWHLNFMLCRVTSLYNICYFENIRKMSVWFSWK
jgi:hypothetical protein